VSGLNLGLRTAKAVCKIAEDGMAETQRAMRMLCDELQMQEASYEMLVEVRRLLLEQIETLKEQRDEARRLVCELDANGSLEAGTPTTVAGDRGWAYLYGKEVVK
jgi:phosphoserine phosphatase